MFSKFKRCSKFVKILKINFTKLDLLYLNNENSENIDDNK